MPRFPEAAPRTLTAVDRGVLAADQKMTAARLRPWMRPEPQPVVMAMRARGLSLLAENDEPESLVDQPMATAPRDLVDALRCAGAL